jgi:antitoxin ParD1/3/4
MFFAVVRASTRYAMMPILVLGKISRYISAYREQGALLMQMNVSLTPMLYEAVQDKVRSGQYSNASEVVRDAIRRMDERAIVDAAWHDLNETLEAAAESGRTSATVTQIVEQAKAGKV